jgi:tRNA-intron endonuclease
MDVTFDGDRVHAGKDARERFYDSRGYGTPRGGDLELAPVEAAHLLYRGDLDAVRDTRTDERLGFQAFLGSGAVPEVGFFVYKDLRDRGFYLSPADHEGFHVYPRGSGPWDDEVAYRVRAVSERADVSADELAATAEGEGTGVLAVVDEESEVSYFELGTPEIEGATDHDVPAVTGALLADRVLVAEPPEPLHDHAFYGQRLDRDDAAVQLSLVEAAYLARTGVLALDGGESGGDTAAITERGREVEGERFDRRLRVYESLRESDVVPKTGFKFGADFRTYADVASVDDLGHSEYLVRVVPADRVFSPRDLALDVRLAHGVRKEMRFALVGEGIEWLSVTRLTP